MIFYQRLRDLREDSDKSQEDIAAILSTTRQQYARWETGSYQMPIENYKILAKYYNVSIDYLCGLVREPKTVDGKPYRVTNKNITINNQGGNNKINIKN